MSLPYTSLSLFYPSTVIPGLRLLNELYGRRMSQEPDGLSLVVLMGDRAQTSTRPQFQLIFDATFAIAPFRPTLLPQRNLGLTPLDPAGTASEPNPFFQGWNTFDSDFDDFYARRTIDTGSPPNQSETTITFEEVATNVWDYVSDTVTVTGQPTGFSLPVTVDVYDDEAAFATVALPLDEPQQASVLLAPSTESMSTSSRRYGGISGNNPTLGALYDFVGVGGDFDLDDTDVVVLMEDRKVEIDAGRATINQGTAPAIFEYDDAVPDTTRFDRWGVYEIDDPTALDAAPWTVQENMTSGLLGYAGSAANTGVIQEWRILGRNVRYRVRWETRLGNTATVTGSGEEEVMDGLYSPIRTVDNTGEPAITDRDWLFPTEIAEWDGADYQPVTAPFENGYAFVSRHRGAVANRASNTDLGQVWFGAPTPFGSQQTTREFGNNTVDGYGSRFGTAFSPQFFRTVIGNVGGRNSVRVTAEIDDFGNYREPLIEPDTNWRDNGGGPFAGYYLNSEIDPPASPIATVSAQYSLVSAIQTGNAIDVTINLDGDERVAVDYTGSTTFPATAPVSLAVLDVRRSAP